jgi:DNA-binding MarR family transcriptional regulator
MPMSERKKARTDAATNDARSKRGPKAVALSPPINVGLLPNLLGYNIRRAQIALWRDLTRSLGEVQVRPAEFSLMILVEANPGVAQIELAQQLDVDKATIVGVVGQLQRQKWVTRKQSTVDRRRQGLYLTPLGQRELQGLRQTMIEHEARFTRLFSAEELGQLFAFLRRIHP